jgi:hypothetical protein
LGSNIIETDADENGFFSIAASLVPANASWNIVYQSPKWKVTKENSTVPKNYFQGDVFQEAFWTETNAHIRATVQPFDATILKSLNYFYNASHTFHKWEDTNGIHVIAHTSSNGSYNGLFTYTNMNTCHITIFRNNVTDRNRLMGTVFHEIGHFVHYKERGGK